MKDLAILTSEQAVTTSLEVAKEFQKNHKDVLRAIAEKISHTSKHALSKKMFKEATYRDASGKHNKMYYMNRDGFVLITMGFTGKEADDFKFRYIEAINKGGKLH